MNVKSSRFKTKDFDFRRYLIRLLNRLCLRFANSLANIDQHGGSGHSSLMLCLTERNHNSPCKEWCLGQCSSDRRNHSCQTSSLCGRRLACAEARIAGDDGRGGSGTESCTPSGPSSSVAGHDSLSADCLHCTISGACGHRTSVARSDEHAEGERKDRVIAHDGSRLLSAFCAI